MAAVRASAVTTVGREGETLPGALLRQAREQASMTALRDRHRGRWRETTWEGFARRTAQAGLALAELGVRPGDRVAVQAQNRSEWVIADLAIQGIGAVSVGVAPASSAAEVASVLDHCGARVAIVEDEWQLEKILRVRHRLPVLERLVVMDEDFVRGPDDRGIATFAELAGAVPAAHAVTEWTGRVEALEPVSVAAIAYTAGTTEPPKGCMLTHANLEWAGTLARMALEVDADDAMLSTMTLARAFERVLSAACAVQAGCAVSFGEGRASFLDDLREVQPTLLAALPEAWQQVVGRADAGEGGQGHRRRRKEIGLSRLRTALCVGAPVPSTVVTGLEALGIEVREAYGLTESTGVCTLAPPGASRVGTVGQAPAGVEVRIVAGDEILVRSPGVFAGYVGDEPATRAAIDPQGWLHTGDLGMFEPDGFLTITGRKRRPDRG